MPHLREWVRQAQEQLAKAVAAGNTTMAAELRRQIRAAREQMRASRAGRPSAATQQFEDRFQQILTDLGEAYRTGDTALAVEAARAKAELEQDLKAAYQAEMAGSSERLQGSASGLPVSEELLTMWENAQGFFFPETVAQAVGTVRDVTVPGVPASWQDIYGTAAEAEAAKGRIGPGTYTLTGGWTSGFDLYGLGEASGAVGEGTTPPPGNTPWLGGDISEAGQEGTQLFGQPWSVTGPVTGAPLPVGSKETVIPAGATLIRVRDPMGADADQMYYLRYTINGVSIIYEIGDMNRFHELFPGRAADNFNVEVLNGTEFLRRGYFNVGLVDEILGASESLGSMFEREMFAATQGGGLAEWVRNDPEALYIFTLGTLEGWDTSRINTALSRTTAFHNRFNGYNDFISKHWPKAGDVDVAVALQQYVEWEGQIAEYLRYWRGPDTNTRHEYLGKLIGSGWTPGQIAQLLPIESNLKEFPDTLGNLNEILSFMGLNTVGLGDFLKIATGNAPQPVVEALSDFNLYQQLMAEGLTFDSTKVAEMRFGTEGDQIAQRADFSAMSRSLAQAILSNRAELNVSKYGLNRDDLLAAALGRSDFISGGRSPAQVEDLLNKFLRERQAAAGGYESWSSYLSDRDRLQVQGLSGL